MWPFTRKPLPMPEPVREPAGIFSTGHLPLDDQHDKVLHLSRAVPAHGQAMDSAQLPMADAMHAVGIPDAQLYWYASQGFIGYQACAVLAQHWLIDKACLMPARDAVRVGYEVDSDDERIVEAIHKADKRHRVAAQMRELVHMGRIFGIRVAIFRVDSADPEYYSKPFNVDGVQPGSYRGISQVDPMWVSPLLTGASVSDPASMRFYDPEFYLINGTKYHRSHLCVYTPFPVPDLLKPGYQYGGVSLPQRIYERVYAAERTANEAPQLAMTKRLSVLKVNASAFFANIDQAKQNLMAWIGLRDNYGVKVVDKESEDLTQFDTGLADLDATIMTQYQLVASIANVPATKLLGTTPKGFNSTGEYEEASYREELESIQTNDLSPLLERHHALVMRSEIAPRLRIEPVAVHHDWRPLDSPTAAEWATINKTKAETAAIYANLGAIDGLDVRDQIKLDKFSDFHGLADIDDDLPDDDGEQSERVAAPAGEESIAQVSMNGAQIASLVEVLSGVAAGTMPAEVAREIIGSAFPLDPATINRMIAPMLDVEVVPSEPQAPAFK